MGHMGRKKRLRTLARIMTGLAAVALVSGALGGCGSDTVESPPAQTSTLAPTATPPPTSTLAPTPTLTPTPTLIPTATPWPENVNPLTGEMVSDSSLLERVPVAIKISNWPGQYVRPQAGINSADLIYEHYNEGWFASRWTAVYLGKDPERVGPVRSGRLIDLEIPAMYKAVLGCSGFSDGVLALVKDSDLYPNWVASPSVGVGAPVFYRDYSRDVPLEHTMYTSPALVREWAAERGISGRQELAGMIFSEELAVEGEPATTIKIPWRTLDAEWRYDEASERYLRWSDGAPHTDALDGQQLSAANVVVLYVPQWNTDIIEEPHMRVDAFWQRWEREDMLTLTDEEGNPIPLKVGNTFFEVIPTGEQEVEVIIEPQ